MISSSIELTFMETRRNGLSFTLSLYGTQYCIECVSNISSPVSGDTRNEKLSRSYMNLLSMSVEAPRERRL